MPRFLRAAILRRKDGIEWPGSALPIRALDWGGGAALALLLAVIGYVLLHRPLKDDIAWLLYLAGQMLDGRRLYVDFIEINPPLIIWLSSVPVAAGRLLGVAAGPLFLAMSALLMLGCAWLTSGILRSYSALFANRFRVFVVVAGVVLLMPGPEFGQREHLLVALVLPYLALLAVRMAGRAAAPSVAMSAGIGVLAGIGIALKPQYLLAFVLLEGFAAATRLRPFWRRPEALGATVFLGGYGASIAWLYPSYITTIVPLARDLYGASDASLGELLFAGRYLLLPLAVLLPLIAADKGAWGRDRLAWVALIFAAGGLLAYLVQGKGWLYHRLPPETVLMLLLVYWIVQALQRDPEHGQRFLPASSLAVAALLGALGASALNRIGQEAAVALQPSANPVSRLAEVIRENHAHSLLVLSEKLAPAFPVVNMTGVHWTSRFDTMWALRGEIRRQQWDRDDASQGAALPIVEWPVLPWPTVQWPVVRWIVDDFIAGRPDVVVVDEHADTDFLAALQTDPRFATAWPSYRRGTSFAGMRVYIRQATPPPDPGEEGRGTPTGDGIVHAVPAL